MRTKANIELEAGVKSFAAGLLPELIGALRRCGPGNLLAVISSEEGLGADLETWCRFTRNTLVDTTVEAGRKSGELRWGEAPVDSHSALPLAPPLCVSPTLCSDLPSDILCLSFSPTLT